VLATLWIEERDELNLPINSHKYIIKSKCHFYYNIQDSGYYKTEFLDDEFPAEDGNNDVNQN